MFWLLLNVSLALVFAAIWTGVPLWLVLRHPGRGHQAPVTAAPAQPAQAEEREPALVG